MATPDHTPHGRGYQSELLYFGHANDYWTSGEGASGCLKPKPTRVVDLWNLSPDAPEGTPEGGARTQVAQCNFTELGDWSMQKVTGDRCVPGADGDHWYGGYEDALFEQRMLDVIERHEPSQPLFLFWAPHSVHTPYEVPGPFMERFDFIAGEHDRMQPTLLAGLCLHSDGAAFQTRPWATRSRPPTGNAVRCSCFLDWRARVWLTGKAFPFSDAAMTNFIDTCGLTPACAATDALTGQRWCAERLAM